MIHAGAASADFTPKPGLVLQGHWSQQPSTQVLAPLEARALVFRGTPHTAALVTLDVIAVDRGWVAGLRKKVAQRCDVPAGHVMIAASHTHSAPASTNSLGMTPDASFLASVEEAAVSCVKAAAAKAEPVRLGLGTGSAAIHINRRPHHDTPGGVMIPNYGGVVDRRVRCMRVDRVDGSPLAVMFHFSCHPTTLSGSRGRISPDYVGVARAAIEAEMGCPAMFLPGCFANIRPMFVDGRGHFAEATDAWLAAAGRQVGMAAVHAVQDLRTREHERVAVASVAQELAFAPCDADAILEASIKRNSVLANAVIKPWWERKKSGGHDGPASEPAEMQAMTVGPLSLVTIPGEPVQEIGLAIEKELADVHGGRELLALGYSNDMLGYLVTQRQKQEGGYEPMAYPYYGRPGPFVDEETALMVGARQVVTQLSRIA